MSSPNGICCDANIVVSLVLEEESVRVLEQWQTWQDQRVRLIAPSLFRYEVTNACHRRAQGSGISEAGTSLLLKKSLNSPVEIIELEMVHIRAATLARVYGRPDSYDCSYLALAELFDFEFWTMDKRLYNSVQPRLPWVHLLD